MHVTPSFAGRKIAWGFGPFASALLVAFLSLTACGDNAAPSAGGDPQQVGIGPAGSSTAPGDSETVGGLTSVAGPTGPLDTTTWVLAPPFSAAGDEPFWRMEIVDGWFSFKRSGLRAIEEPLVQPRSEDGADIFDTGSLRVVIRREACQTEQGGSGEFSAKVTFDGLDFDGCAFGGGSAVAASVEAATVAESLTPIDACLAKLGQPAVATAIYPRQDGEQTAVAMRAKSGAFYECVTEQQGTSVVSLDAIDQGGQPAWMNRMRFLRDGVSATTCADAEEVRVGDKVVGRLLGKSCKF
jgi:uncharacterized membrane protein